MVIYACVPDRVGLEHSATFQMCLFIPFQMGLKFRQVTYNFSYLLTLTLTLRLDSFQMLNLLGVSIQSCCLFSMGVMWGRCFSLPVLAGGLYVSHTYIYTHAPLWSTWICSVGFCSHFGVGFRGCQKFLRVSSDPRHMFWSLFTCFATWNMMIRDVSSVPPKG